MDKVYKIPLQLDRQPDGGYIVTCPLLPELITEGDTLDTALAHVNDALDAVIELYEDLKKPLPPELCLSPQDTRVEFETVLALP